MFKLPTIAGSILTLCACVFISCDSLKLHDSRSETPLATERKTFERLNLAPDAVVFDVLIAHIPYNERDLVRNLWRDADELELNQTTRRALNDQGFRVGVLGAATPESLSKLLALKGRELRSSIEERVDYSKVESALAPIAYSKPVSLRSGMKSTIVVRSDVIPSVPILEKNDEGELEGKTYSNASPVFSVAIEQLVDGSVLFDVSPFLRYGAPQLTTRYQHGQLVKTQEQPTKSFDNLRFSQALRPGQFLVVGASDAKTNALGRYFFSEGGDDFEQTALIIRLLVTQHDGQIDRFPNFKELITDEEDDYLDNFGGDFQKSEPDIIMKNFPDVDDSGDRASTGGFEQYDGLKLDDLPDLNEISDEEN